MVSKGVRVVRGGGLLPIALLLLARGAAAQAQPAKAPATPVAPTANARPDGAAPNARPGAPAAGAPTALSATPANAAASVPVIDTGVSDEQKAQAIQQLKERLRTAGPGQGLTSDQAARRAMQTNATVEAKKKALEGAQVGIDAANAAYWPQLKLSASYTRLSPVTLQLGAATFSLPTDQVSFDAALQVPISDYVFKVSHGVAAASRQRDAAAYDRNATLASVARDTRVAYYTWVRQQMQVVIQEQAVEQAQKHQRDTQNSFGAGLASKADVLKSQSDVANAMLQLETARNNTAVAAAQLDVAMGLPPGQQPQLIGEEVFVEAPELAALPTADAGLREAMEKRAELKTLDANSAASREQAKSARVGNYPRLDASAAANYSKPNQRYFVDTKFHDTWQAGVVLSWTPTAIPLNDATASQAEVKATELAAQRRAAVDGMKVEIEQALRSAQTARYSISVATTQLTSAEEGHRVRTELFRAGRGTNVELTDAETTLTNARIQLADAYISARIALVQLGHALGRDAAPPSANGAEH
jgi:outer membrane protein TolC